MNNVSQFPGQQPALQAAVLNAHALNHPKVVEFARVISQAQNTGNMDLIRQFLLLELSTFVSNYDSDVFEVATVTASEFLRNVNFLVKKDQAGAADESSPIITGGG